MATLSYMTQSQLDSALSSNIESSVRTAIYNQLSADFAGGSPPGTVWVEQDSTLSVVYPSAQVLDLTGATNYINVDQFPALDVIIEDVQNANLLVQSSTRGVLVAAGTGDDTVQLFGSASDTVMGGSGNDIIGDAGSGNSKIYGGAGDDTLMAGSGQDTLYADGGNDVLVAGSGDYQVLDARGSSGNNALAASTGAHQKLYGGSGSDTLYGGSGDYQSLYAGASDTVPGALTTSLGTVKDFLVAGTGGHQYLEGNSTNPGQYQTLWDPGQGPGNDTLSAGTHGGAHYMVGAGADTLYGGSGADTLIGSSGGSFLYAGSGGNELVSASDGAHGGNQLYGGAGNDALAGGAGADSLYAEGGSDTLYGGSGDYQVLDATTYSTASNVLVAGTGAHQLLELGTGGGSAADYSSGTDTLMGNTGNDYLVGHGNDTLIGGGGNDTLVADPALPGQGQQLIGGTGSDLFVIMGTSGQDTVYGSDTVGGSTGENNQLWFADQASSQIEGSSITSADGALSGSITFAGGQTVTFNNIQEVIFGNETSSIIKPT